MRDVSTKFNYAKQMAEITRDIVQELNSRLQEQLNFIQVVLGPRQVGKTTSIETIIQNWTGPKLFVSADLVTPPNANWIRTNWERALALGEGTLFVIDEIQKIPAWSETIKVLFDKGRKQKNLKVVILGSASLSLQKGLSESLAGRFELIPAYHWGFDECRIAFGWSLDQFLSYGGYPASAELIGDYQRWRSFILNSIIEPVLTRDIQGLVQINKPALFRQTLELALSYPAQEISLQKILGQLQEGGNVTTIKHYLELFEGAFLLKLLQKYSGHPLTTKTSTPKIISLAQALASATKGLPPNTLDTDWRGRLFENAVGSYLNRLPGKLYYWREGQNEVDFVFEAQNKLIAIEVKSNRKGFRSGLMKFLEKFPKAHPVVINQLNMEKLLLKVSLDNFFEVCSLK